MAQASSVDVIAAQQRAHEAAQKAMEVQRAELNAERAELNAERTKLNGERAELNAERAELAELAHMHAMLTDKERCDAEELKHFKDIFHILQDM